MDTHFGIAEFINVDCQSRLSKKGSPAWDDTLLTVCFSLWKTVATRYGSPARDDTLLTLRQAIHLAI
ncbi:MAG: hypothetical protein LBQ84_05615, partial [Flavobacteriaceae bacterium]|nr:hypothetical protein [Flavobacteriaceae bacterium]